MNSSYPRRLPYYLWRPRVLWRNRHKIKLWRRLSYWLIQQLGWSERFSASYYGARFHPFPSSLSKAIWLFGEQFRRQDMLFLGDLLRSGDTFVDVGANVGTHSICMAPIVGEKGCIYSYEPHPRIFSYLQKNIQLNRITTIQAFNVALGEDEGIATLCDEPLDDRNWITPTASSGGIKVPVRSLDSMGVSLSGAGVMKIDIEGYELYALRGAERTLHRMEFLYLEIGDRHTLRLGYSSQELLRFLQERGWRLFRFETPACLVEIDATYAPPDVENIVAARSAESLRMRLNRHQVIAMANP